MATSTATATKWRGLNEDEKPTRGQEIRIPGDKQPLGVVIKVGPSGITYRPHGGGALQLISSSAEVEVRATADEPGEKKEKAKTTKPEPEKPEKKANAKKSKAVAAKPKPEPKQLEIEEPGEEEDEDGEAGEVDADAEEAGGDGDETETDNETGKDTDVAKATKPVSGGGAWMRIEQLVEESGVPLGRILKARREGAFEGMTKPDPDYDGVGRKPLIYSPAALKIATGLTSSGKGGRPSKSGNPAARRMSAKTEESTASPVRAATVPKRHIDLANRTAKAKPPVAPAQSHLYAAGESLQTTLDGINAEIARLTDLKARLEEAWSFFEA